MIPFLQNDRGFIHYLVGVSVTGYTVRILKIGIKPGWNGVLEFRIVQPDPKKLDLALDLTRAGSDSEYPVSMSTFFHLFP